MDPRLLVIGGSGFIGKHLLERSIENGWVVTSLSKSVPERKIDGVKYLSADAGIREEMMSTLGDQSFEYVVNLGGYIDHSLFSRGGRDLIRSHFDAVQNMVEMLDRKTLIRFVQVGSSDEYGNSSAGAQKETQREHAISPYSLGKMAATHFLQMIHRTESFPAVIVRLFLTYGPGQGSDRFIPQAIQGCLKDEKFPVSAGEQLRDFCFVNDTVTAIEMVLRNEVVEGEILNVSSGVPRRIREVIEIIQSIVGAGRPEYGRIPYRSGENMSLYADISKIRNLCNWEPRVSLEKGLTETVKWWESRYDV